MPRGVILACAVGFVSLASNALGSEEIDSYSPWAGKHYPREVYWGDTHLHTSYSVDANLFGNIGMTPMDAYRFARGETVTASNGMKARLNEPLDFLVVADHAEYLGVIRLIRQGEPAIMDSDIAKRWRASLSGEGDSAGIMREIAELWATGESVMTIPKGVTRPWVEISRMADRAYAPGIFTTFIGFEWSSMPNGNNLHRVVVFRDGADKTTQVEPFSVFDSSDPADLWHYMAAYEEKTGGDVLAIPHNSNLSGGLMFAKTELNGRPISADYARRRSQWEPIMEVTQIKGDSEAHPYLSPEDEFADFGTWDQYNLGGSEPQQPWMLQYEYARSALQVGLQLAQRTGINPYRLGMIGGTDSHTALSAVEEDNFWGKNPRDEPSAARVASLWGLPELELPNTRQQAAGYAAVWATANTREAIFDAMERREVYASTGPRIRVRFFGGWQFTEADLSGPQAALTGYEKGVPMGSRLPSRPSRAESPVFMVWALKDADGANLDRIQIIKGWVDADGETHEKVYDVAWSGNRKPGLDGDLPPVGNTVNLETATYRNTIGNAQLAAVWTDPDFDPDQRAFYYTRVLEIPTPRWVVYDKVRLDARLPEGTKLIQQERAYTSPIWYKPGG